MKVRFHPEAEAELAAARVWYGIQRKGLDAELMSRIDEALKHIIDNPYGYPIVYRELRRTVVRKFPFAVFYEPTSDEIFVFAVFHSRRDPMKLRSRR